MKKELETILEKYKVIGDTTYGLGYKETSQLIDEIISTFVNTITTHTEHNGRYCDTGEDMEWSCRSECMDLAVKRLLK